MPFIKTYLSSNCLTLSWRRPLSYRNQSIDLQSKSLDWFLYDNGFRHERVKALRSVDIWLKDKLSSGLSQVVSLWHLTHIMPLVSFDTPWKHLVFWCFQGVSKETSNIKRVKGCFKKDHPIQLSYVTTSSVVTHRYRFDRVETWVSLYAIIMNKRVVLLLMVSEFACHDANIGINSSMTKVPII